ncbi:hypothetical protein F4703DRAFT_1768808, partial [Phycomyces blakesleeanus]
MYKYRRQNVPASNYQSKVGSMILEFDALAQQQQEEEDEDVSAWLLLDNKAIRPMSIQTVVPKSSESMRLYQSLSRKDGHHLSSLVASGMTPEDTTKRNRDHTSPYYYVELLRSRSTPFETLVHHLVLLERTLSAGNIAWINEFLSRRHDGLAALESVLERLEAKKKKKRNFSW